jgi:putative NADH-flavin reductase
MHIILEGTGHIGSALAGTLLELGEAVTVVSRDEKKRARWEEKGAKVALVDILDVEALEGSRIQKVVTESTYGAQPGKGLGDLGVLYRMEHALAGMKRPVSIIRGAYYMSNWAMAKDEVKRTGQLFTLYSADFKCQW